MSLPCIALVVTTRRRHLLAWGDQRSATEEART